MKMLDRIISILKSRDGYISGGELGSALGITRAGVWKKIKTLRQKGYNIKAVPSKGYELLVSPDVPFKEEITAIFKGDIIGREIIFYDVTTSTNEKAIELAQKPGGMIEGTVIIADSQERGRGRFGRTWISPRGVNLYFTVLLKPPFSAKEASVITLMAAVAAVSAIREHAHVNAAIKWPNDILVGDKKVGGILTEMKSDMDMVDFIAAGIGINVNMSVNSLPENLRDCATSLREEKGESINRVRLLGAILAGIEHWYKILLRGEKKALLGEWMRLNCTTGKKVSVKTHDKILTGDAVGIGEDGELILRFPSGNTEKIYAGEVTIVKRR